MPCQFTLTRGPRRGQPCGAPLRNGRIRHDSLCARHLAIESRREQQQQRQQMNDLVQQLDRFQVSEPYPVQEEKELVYESCHMCHSKIEGAKVTLDCGCEYHLNCYLIVQNETHCIKCGDKINKTKEDCPECSICLEIIKKNGKKTKCGHHFHKKCIRQWRRIKHNCPNCRAHL